MTQDTQIQERAAPATGQSFFRVRFHVRANGRERWGQWQAVRRDERLLSSTNLRVARLGAVALAAQLPSHDVLGFEVEIISEAQHVAMTRGRV